MIVKKNFSWSERTIVVLSQDVVVRQTMSRYFRDRQAVVKETADLEEWITAMTEATEACGLVDPFHKDFNFEQIEQAVELFRVEYPLVWIRSLENNALLETKMSALSDDVVDWLAPQHEIVRHVQRVLLLKDLEAENTSLAKELQSQLEMYEAKETQFALAQHTIKEDDIQTREDTSQDLNSEIILPECLSVSEFVDRTDLEIQRARRIQLSLSLAVLQIDQFEVHYPYRTEEKEDLLIQCAKIFKSHLRVTDEICYIGEGQFGILFPHTPQKGAAIKAERFRRFFEKNEFFTKNKTTAVSLTLSGGVTEFPRIGADRDSLFSSARTALDDLLKVTSNRICLASAARRKTHELTSEASLG